MFLDGVTYAAISSMLADGIGSYDAPFYSLYLGEVFYDQLPGGFIVASWFFDILGQHYWVERLYCLVMLCVTIYGLRKVSLSLFDQEVSVRWIVLLYVTIHITFWSYREHVLEVGMTTACVWAVYLGIRAVQDRTIWAAIGCGLVTLLAILSKGPTGAYPLAVPLLYYITVDRLHGHGWVVIIPTLTLGLLAAALYQVDSIKTFADNYLAIQLLPSLAGDCEVTTTHRAGILLDLVSEVAVPLAIALVVYMASTRLRRSMAIPTTDWRRIAFLVLVAASASLPLMLTLKQRRFYLLPSLPFYAMAIAYWSSPYIKVLATALSQRSRRIAGGIGLALTLTAVTLMGLHAGGYARDQDLISDVVSIGTSSGQQALISADAEVCRDWATHAYFARYARLSLRCDTVLEHHIVKEGERLVLLGD